MSMTAPDLSLLGLNEQKCKETAKNKELCSRLGIIIKKALAISDSISKPAGTLLYHIGTRMKAQIRNREDFVVAEVIAGRLTSELQLNAAFKYLLDSPSGDVNRKAFNEACGIGVVVTPEQIETAVETVVEKYRAELLTERYRFNVGKLLGEAKAMLPWADGKSVKSEMDVQLISLIGARTSEDNAKPAKKEKKAKTEDSTKTASSAPQGPSVGPHGEVSFIDVMGEADRFHKTGENYKTDGYVITERTMELLKEHLTRTGGKVVTRFPPEPNGILHIGHAKAINFNFGFAKKHNGITYLRYDDTNPEKEEEKFFVGILDMVRWLGYEPYKVTHASDNFQQLFEWAVDLIRRGLAYVCHQKGEELKGHNPPPSPWRDRPIEESLQLFEDMKRGKIAEGDATLRMKTTLEDGKQDPVAYRIKFTAHHRTGDAWCIYPTYDFTHCLCDSIEDITHSLCTKEFQSRRSSYYWLCNSLDVYCPVQWEYGRLNLHYALVSKRKILKLITAKVVRDWDDPRLFTLTALRRRGVPPAAINFFCARVGVTMSQTVLDPVMLDACVREVLNVTAPRAMAVLEPLRVTVTNWAALGSLPTTVSVPDFPAQPERGSHDVALGPEIFIERSDFREAAADKNYKRLAPDQEVGLRHTGLALKVERVAERDPQGRPVRLEASCRRVEEGAKPKGFVHWVSDGQRVEVRLYDQLFSVKSPEEHPDGFLAAIKKNSLTVLTGVLVDKSVTWNQNFRQYQFERNGYFSVDPDSTPSKPVFNRTVTLREDPSKEV